MYLCRRCFEKYREHVKSAEYTLGVVACDVCGAPAEFRVDDRLLEVLHRMGGVKVRI